MGAIKPWKLNKVTGIVEVMLEELVVRKEKLAKFERAKMIWSLAVMFCLAVFLFFGYDTLSKSEYAFGTNLLSSLLANAHLLLLVLILSVGLTQVRHFEKKSKKAEKEFEGLREELMERSSELWNEDYEWRDRQDVYDYMKKEFDINLFYK
ncbi:DUF2663 family protein [Bacillus solitudinis]|uniref:DUF2663 family protein n=1 Tax=Bacillus solitudinis TaxID=2014074 RepID=UPI000C2477C6|nr:DUF2663 family protein [Bacillus solitudinis]